LTLPSREGGRDGKGGGA